MENFQLQQYRRDRRKLLDFILSSDLVKEIRAPPGASGLNDIDLDTVSADHVLECAKSGGPLDVSEATKKFFDERDFPIMITSQSGNSYFLLSETGISGSPPRRMPPQVEAKQTPNNIPESSKQYGDLADEEIVNYEQDLVECTGASDTPEQPVKDASVLSLGLPSLRTGLSDEDIRETAYEVLLASMVLSGDLIYSSEDKKREKKSKFLTMRRSKRDNSQPHSTGGHHELLDMIRSQLEISEMTDACTRKGLTEFALRATSGHIDVPQISLGLLNEILKSDFPNERSYIQWLKRQANVLEEFLYSSADIIKDGHTVLRGFLSKLRNSEVWATVMTASERAKVLTAIGKFASKLSNIPSKFGIPGETYYWISGYHLNVKLYEKLLCGVFDILEEGQLVQGAEEILGTLRLTWSILGVTQRMHHTLYGWVLFRQFVITGEALLLEHALCEIQKVVASEDGGGNEVAYMNSLICSNGAPRNTTSLSLVDAVFMSVNIWCDSQLQDYHLHFFKFESFERVLNLAVAVGTLTEDGSSVSKAPSTHRKKYVERSIQAAYHRAFDMSDSKSKAEKRHPLAVLAEEIKLIAERDSTIFSPLLCHWFPEARVLSLLLLHQLYGERLKPFLDGLSKLSEDARSVLPAADLLDYYLTQQFQTECGEDVNLSLSKKLYPYQIGDVCGPLILQWLNTQHDNILEWAERAFHLEEWEPLSFQKWHAASIVEIFRIIEETVDQFFGLKLPMDVMHLQSLLFGIAQCLESYLLKLVSQLVDKKHLYPTLPPLTRYKEATNPFVKKKLAETTYLEEKVHNQLNELTTSKLCVRLNTLNYIQNQIATLEDSIRNSWMLVRPGVNPKLRKNQLTGAPKGLSMCCESVDESFTIFNSVKKMADEATERIIDLIGIRVVFWDLRDSFLFSLYRGDVTSARLDSVLQELDNALDHICDLLVDNIRNPVVLSICRASLEGYVRVLLDGGPFRVFCPMDNKIMQEDLNMLKDFFVANGEGLPCGIVELEAKLAQQIIDLYGLRTEDIVEMLMIASELITTGSDGVKVGRSAEDANTLLRILCHKRDSAASKFLKRHYQLPKSSDYEDSFGKSSSTSKSPLISDLLKKTSSFHWNEKGQKSFRTMKKKLQEATF